MLATLFENAKRYGPPNYFDRLKLIAIITMTLDHIAMCLLPESDVLRAIGRVSMPLWLFAAGYHVAGAGKDWQSREAPLLIATFLLLVVNIAVSKSVFPLFIPFSILLCRRILLWPAFRRVVDKQPLVPFAVLLFTFYPTMLFVEYGTFTLAFALLGWWTARGENITLIRIFALYTAVLYGLVENVLFGFMGWMEWLVYFGVGLATLLPLDTKPGEWKWLSAKPMAAATALLFTRNTLFYYTAHLIILKIAQRLLYPPEMLWHFRLF